MSRASEDRASKWIWLLVIGAGLLFALIFGLPMYMRSTATRFFPEPQGVPSVSHSDVSAQWAPAVARSRDIVREGLSAQNLPGISVAVGVGGEIVWAEGFGWANVDKHTPVTPEMRFRIGTASKMLTSAAVGRLLDKGRVKLDDDIQTYVPEFPKKQWPVTLRQVMANVSGVRNDGGDEGELYGRRCGRPVEGLRAFADRELLFEPETKYRESNYGWILVSAAVESAAKKPFYAFIREQVFDPIGMRDTVEEAVVKEPSELPNTATSYFPRFAADPRAGYQDMRELNVSCYAGAMAFVSTPSDLVRFGMAFNNGKLLRPATAQLLQSEQRLTSGQTTGHGLGWRVGPGTLGGEQTQTIGADGAMLAGKMLSLVTVPKLGIAVAVASNMSYSDTSSVAQKVAEAFAEQAKSTTKTSLRDLHPE